MNRRRIAYSADDGFLSAAVVALLSACVWAWRDARAAERTEAGEP